MRRFALPLVVVALAASGGCSIGGDDEPKPASASSRPSPAITRAELEQHLVALQRIADRNGGNRSAGTPGYDASADYVAERLRQAGWTVTRQSVPFTYFQVHSASLAVGGRELTRAKQFQVLSYSGSGQAEGTLRSSGLGCSSADFAGLEGDQVPLAERGVCFFRQKARTAEEAGAKALVVVEPVRSRRGVPSGTLAVPGSRIPVVVMSRRALGHEGDGSRVSIEVDATKRGGRTENVIAETPGGNGRRVVMAGGHLDSVPGGPGIDDNGSGAVALIESAEAIGPNPPGARLRLGFWAAEELGLLGSRHYVRSLDSAERRRIAAYINLDMVGSPNAVPEVYADGDPKLARVLRKATGRHLGGATAGQASDHTFFQLAGIPINGLYTGATEAAPGGKPRDPCYHLACDTIDNVNRPVLLTMTKTATRALRALSARHK